MDGDTKKRQQRKINALLSQLARTARIEIQSTRKDKGLKQSDVAELMAWTDVIVGNIETGRRELSLPEFVVLAQQMGADPVTMLKRMLVR